jgi:hypothetical protein
LAIYPKVQSSLLIEARATRAGTLSSSMITDLPENNFENPE